MSEPPGSSNKARTLRKYPVHDERKSRPRKYLYTTVGPQLTSSKAETKYRPLFQLSPCAFSYKKWRNESLVGRLPWSARRIRSVFKRATNATADLRAANLDPLYGLRVYRVGAAWGAGTGGHGVNLAVLRLRRTGMNPVCGGFRLKKEDDMAVMGTGS